MPGPINTAARAPRLPLYEDSHPCCSVLLGRIANIEQLRRLPTHEQFRWMHRFYDVVDRIAGQHKVLKSHGGHQSFQFSSGVAEPDEEHAATLLRFAVHLHVVAQDIRFPSKERVDLRLSLACGEASSGLLGSLSLTYQIVGPCVHEAQEMLDTQPALPFMVAGSMRRELKPEVARGLVRLGSLPLLLGKEGNQEEEAEEGAISVYSLPKYGDVSVVCPSKLHTCQAGHCGAAA